MEILGKTKNPENELHRTAVQKAWHLGAAMASDESTSSSSLGT